MARGSRYGRAIRGAGYRSNDQRYGVSVQRPTRMKRVRPLGRADAHRPGHGRAGGRQRRARRPADAQRRRRRAAHLRSPGPPADRRSASRSRRSSSTRRSGGGRRDFVRDLQAQEQFEDHAVSCWTRTAGPCRARRRSPRRQRPPARVADGERVGHLIAGHARGGYLFAGQGRAQRQLDDELEAKLDERRSESAGIAAVLALLLGLIVALRVSQPLHRAERRRAADGARRDRVARRRLGRQPRDAGARADARPARGRAAPPGRAAPGHGGRRRARDAQRARRRRGAPRGDPGRRGPGREGGAASARRGTPGASTSWWTTSPCWPRRSGRACSSASSRSTCTSCAPSGWPRISTASATATSSSRRAWRGPAWRAIPSGSCRSSTTSSPTPCATRIPATG